MAAASPYGTLGKRETVYQALFALVQPLGPDKGNLNPLFKTVTREVIEVQRIPPGEQPVLMMYEMDEHFRDGGEQLVPNVWTVIFIFGVTTKKGTPGQTVLNPLIDAVLNALAPQGGDEKQTLGNLVENVQVSGRAGKDHGNNSTAADARQASYYLPVEITLAGS